MNEAAERKEMKISNLQRGTMSMKLGVNKSSGISKLILAIAFAAGISSCSKNNVKPEGENLETAVTSAPEVPITEVTPEITNSPMKTNSDGKFSAEGSDSGSIAGLNTINFEYDKSGFTSESKQKLKANADWMKQNTSVTLQIEGHCDSRGSVEYNLALGERRAKAVKSYLEGLGVESRRMNIISFGKEKPAVPGDSESAMAKNRRANFVPL
jgi:peptidoglycan-associated lipoprotein